MGQSVRDHSTLIGALGGAAKLAEAIEVLPVTARAWTARNRIPPDYWEDIIRCAAASKIEVDASWLLRTLPARSGARVEKGGDGDHDLDRNDLASDRSSGKNDDLSAGVAA